MRCGEKLANFTAKVGKMGETTERDRFTFQDVTSAQVFHLNVTIKMNH